MNSWVRPAEHSICWIQDTSRTGSTDSRYGELKYAHDQHLISKRSHVLVPSPQGDFLVVMCSTLVGMRTGPFTLRLLSLAPLMRSAHTAQTFHSAFRARSAVARAHV